MVLHAKATREPTARAALETLCRDYWYPLYAFVRRQGNSHHQAEDLTQGFFIHLLSSDAIARAQPERGRFRTFLLAALRNFMTSEWRRAHAAKRGGGAEPLPLPLGGAEERFAAETPDSGLTPEEAFDRNWALSLIDRELAHLRAEYTGSGRGHLFEALAPHVWGDATVSQATEAARLGMNEHAFTVAVSRLRKRLRERLRAAVAATVADEATVSDELRHLLAALRARRTGV